MEPRGSCWCLRSGAGRRGTQDQGGAGCVASASGGCRQARLQSMGSLESDMTERLHFHFSPSCTGEGNGNPLQCSCLENPGYGEAWWAAVSGVAQSWTHLKQLSSSSSREKKAPLAPSLPPAALPVAGPCLLWAAPSCPRLWGQVATSPHRSPVPLGATGMPTCLELPGRAHPASGWRPPRSGRGSRRYGSQAKACPGKGAFPPHPWQRHRHKA